MISLNYINNHDSKIKTKYIYIYIYIYILNDVLVNKKNISIKNLNYSKLVKYNNSIITWKQWHQ